MAVLSDMSKIKSDRACSKVQPDVIQLLQDEVVSLCQQKYSCVSGIEIDGIICISLLDTKEEQVVKIHRTLKSVMSKQHGDVTEVTKPDSYPQISAILSFTSGASKEKGNDEAEKTEPHNFQSDINTLSELLKASNEVNKQEELAAAAAAVEASKKSKRKRKDPKHRGGKSEESAKTHSDYINLSTTDTHFKTGEHDIYIDNIITVKEEPIESDDITGCGDQNNPNDLAVTENTDEPPANVSKKSVINSKGELHAGEKVSSLIGKLIDKEILSEVGQQNDAESDQVGTSATDDDHIVVKVERDEGDNNGQEEMELFFPENSDFNPYQDSNSSSDSAMEILKTFSKSKKSCGNEKHWLYGITRKASAGSASFAENETSPNEVAKMALLNKYYEQGSIAQEGPPRERPRQEPDPLGRSWIDMVQSNVNKYQAALLRSNKAKLDNKDNSPQRTEAVKSSTSSGIVLDSAVNLKALLSQKPLNQKHTGESVEDSGRENRSKSLPQSTKQTVVGRSKSISPTPVVKMELDKVNDNETEQLYSKDSGDSNSESVVEPSKENAKQPQGKLESRYPALFNQLQQANSSQDQPDSLVDRLPFISFQELFSQANPGTWTPRMSESATMQLLAKAKVNPYPSKTSNVGKKKSVWKWKKRQVRAKDTTEQRQIATEADEGDGLTSRRSFSRKRQMLDKDFEAKHIDVELRKDSVVTDSNDDGTSGMRRTTRLSAGEKPRINFAEIDNSEEEEEEMEEETEVEMIDPPVSQNDSPIELVSAYCQNNCGMKFATFGELQAHEMDCFAGGSSGMGSDGGGSPAPTVTVGNNTDFKCTICGLEFNQQYRWQYHMIKVHGVAVDKTMFR